MTDFIRNTKSELRLYDEKLENALEIPDLKYQI